MEIKTPYEVFAQAVRCVGGITPARSPRPLLQNIRLTARKKRLELAATDMEVGVRCEIVGATFEGEVDLLLPAQRLLGIIRETKGEEVRIEPEEGRVKIEIGVDKFSLSSMSAEEFPEVAEFGERKAFEIAGRELSEAINRVLFAVAREGTRYAINGVLFIGKGKNLELVSTDGRRLAHVERRIAGGPSTREEGILSAKFLGELQKLAAENPEASIRLALSGPQALAQAGVFVLSGSLVEGRFPAYTEVIPKEKGAPAKMNRVELEAKLRQAKVMTTEESRSVTLTFAKGQLGLQAQTAEVGAADLQMAIEYKGEPLAIGFNPDYLGDVLRVLSGEQVTLELLDGSRPGVIREGESPNSYTYVVMPIKR